VQSWALKEVCYEYLVKMLELALRVYEQLDVQDLKTVLGECCQWYLAANQTIKEITKTEQTKNVFS